VRQGGATNLKGGGGFNALEGGGKNTKIWGCMTFSSFYGGAATACG